jgi:Xaa-Pro dipeptidase
MSGQASPITAEEREGRLERLRALMTDAKVGATIMESGSSLEYFTGIQWRRSERVTAALIPARGSVIVTTPAFEEPSVRETLAVQADVRPWDEHEDPFRLLVQGLRDREAAMTPLAVEPTTRFFILDGMRKNAPGLEQVSGAGLINACRMIKTSHELALMQIANAITLEALRYVHAHLALGMGPADIGAMMDRATVALGGSPEFSLVLLNEASAYPHGSRQTQVVREGSMILMDCGCAVHGYQSDISRSWVFGEASARQRQIWNTVKRGQEIALETARVGRPAGLVDDRVRAYYEGQGFGPGYRLPGLSHRTGHGIGLDGHEFPYLVHGEATLLQPGMCFSDEPGLYLPGAFGVRLEDCWHMTPEGPVLFTPLARSLEDPI